jgi:hypothetical protein
MSISIHPELETKLRTRVRAEGLSVEAYLERLLRAEQSAEDELTTLALDGVHSGDPIEVWPWILGSQASRVRWTLSRRRRTVSTRYVLRPKADQDLDQQAYYMATAAGPETGHRFLVADSGNLRLALDPVPDGLASSSTEPEVGVPAGVSDFRF